MQQGNILDVTGLTVTHYSSTILNQLDFSLRQGEIHILLGQNASGKSTFAKTVMGMLAPQAGYITFTDCIQSMNQAYMVCQDIKLFPNLSVAENAYIHDDQLVYSKKNVHRKFCELCEELDISLDPDSRVSRISAGEKKMLELLKAYLANPDVLILDEVCAFFSRREIDLANGIIRKLNERGCSILYITHSLGDMISLAHRVSILFGGRIIRTFSPDELSNQEILNLMTGRDIKERYPKIDTAKGEAALRFHGISSYALSHVDFTAYRGEILGVTGVSGSGKSNIAKILFGLEQPDDGYVFSMLANERITSPLVAKKSKMAFIDEETMHNLVPNFTADQNLTLSSLDALNKSIFIDKQKEKVIGSRYRSKLRFSMSDSTLRTKYLSGGEKQKLSLARCFLEDAEILVIDEPTKNVDIASKVDVYNMLNFFVSKNKCVILLTSDFAEAAGMCDRVLVVKKGDLVKELMRAEASEHTILSYAL